MIRARWPLTPLVLVALAAALASCWPDRLSDKACDEAHPCVEGYVCLSDICYAEERILFDGGPPPDAGR